MDWTAVIVALIASLPPSLLAAGALIAALRANKAAVQAVESAGQVAEKVDAVHVDINSRMTELIDSTRTEADATGELRGRASERAKTKKKT